MPETPKNMDFRCVQCGFPIKILYVQYSPGNIRLMKCQSCKAVADEYMECEIMILVIDLILHKAKAYRHLFYNMFGRETMNFKELLWRLSFVFLLVDAYRIFILRTNEKEWVSSSSLASLSWISGKILLEVLLGNFLFFGILFRSRVLLNASVEISGYKHILLAILVSSYFKMFLITVMVWEFPPPVIFLIDFFILSSNTLALKVMTESSMAKCLGACLSAHAVKFLVSLLINICSPDLAM